MLLQNYTIFLPIRANWEEFKEETSDELRRPRQRPNAGKYNVKMFLHNQMNQVVNETLFRSVLRKRVVTQNFLSIQKLSQKL